MSDERRKFHRVPTLIDVVWEGGMGTYEARTGDISTGGCFIDTIGQAKVGETINFRLRLPSGEWIALRGKVTYEYPNMGFGVRFTDISDADQKRLEWLVKAETYRAERED